jgi:hypothetical protein
MKLGTVVKPLGYLLIGLLLFVLAGRSSLFAGDGGPYVLQHDLREDPARDLIKAVRDAVRRFRGVAIREAGDDHVKAGRASDADGGQTP